MTVFGIKVGHTLADVPEDRDSQGRDDPGHQRVLDQILAVSAVNQRARKRRESLCEGHPGHV
jgi:hypothetical protein